VAVKLSAVSARFLGLASLYVSRPAAAIILLSDRFTIVLSFLQTTVSPKPITPFRRGTNQEEYLTLVAFLADVQTTDGRSEQRRPYNATFLFEFS
jgi:hypothetical protein